MSLPRAYEDPHAPGALGGVEPFAKAQKLKTPQAQRILGAELYAPQTPTNAFSDHPYPAL